jgi:hypothetical protein
MNSWHLNQLKYAFGIGGFMSFYGVVGIGVWLLGDRFGYGTSQRIVVIALVLLTMPLALIGAYIVSRRAKKQEEKAKEGDAKAEVTAADGKPAEKLAAPTGNYDDIKFSNASEPAAVRAKFCQRDAERRLARNERRSFCRYGWTLSNRRRGRRRMGCASRHHQKNSPAPSARRFSSEYQCGKDFAV